MFFWDAYSMLNTTSFSVGAKNTPEPIRSYDFKFSFWKLSYSANWGMIVLNDSEMILEELANSKSFFGAICGSLT